MKGKDGGPQAGVLPRYARLLESPAISQSRSRREASAAARACFEAMRSRFPGPDAAYVIDLMLHLGEVGSFDFYGSLRTIGQQIGDLLREVIDVARLYRGVRALHGHTCVVERVSRQLWCLRLAGASDPASPHHRRLIAETPTPYRLGAGDDYVEQGQGRVADAAEEIGSLRGRLAVAEEHAAEVVVNRDQLRDELQAMSDLRDQTCAQIEAIQRELVDLRRRLTDAETEQTAAAARRQQLEEVIQQREIENQGLVRQLGVMRVQLEQALVLPVVAVEQDGKNAALKGALKLERERRHAADVRLRRILGVLRAKLPGVPDEDPEEVQAGCEAEKLAASIGGFGRILLELAAERRRELAELEQSAEPDPERVATLREDVKLAEALARHAPS
jgi:hypothetical protein